MLSPLAYALKNVRRRPLRSLAVSVAMAALAITLFMASALYITVEGSVERGADRLGADIMVLPMGAGAGTGDLLLSGAPSTQYLPPGTLDRVSGHPGVELAAPQLFLVSADLACCSVADTSLVGYDPELDLTVTPWIRHGDKAAPGPGEIVVGSKILNETGGRLSFFGSLFVISAKLEPTGMGYFDSSVFIPMESAYKMVRDSAELAEVRLNAPEGAISAVLVKVREGLEPVDVALRLQLDMPGTDVVTASEAITAARSRMLSPVRSLAVAGAFQWIVSLLLVSALMAATLSERRREYGLLKALGASRGKVLSMVLAEVSMLTAFGSVTGVLAGLWAWGVAGPAMFPGSGVLVLDSASRLVLALAVFAFSTASAVLASLIPVSRALRVGPFDSLVSRLQG